MANWNELHKKITVSGPEAGVVEFVGNYLKPGMRVLDLGCGKGRHSIYCAQKGIEVHAVDSAESALVELRKEIEKGQLFELVKVTNCDIKELPFPNGYFDAIMGVNVVQHGYRKDVDAYFSEATRVLRKEALFYLVLTGRAFIDEFIGKDTKEVEKDTFLGLKGVPDHDVPHYAFTDESLGELLRSFEIVEKRYPRKRSPWIGKDVQYIEIVARKK